MANKDKNIDGKPGFVFMSLLIIVIFVTVFVARRNHSEANEYVEKVIEFNNSAKDSISILVSYIDELKHDTTMFRLKIRQQDSTIRVYSDNKNYMELVINNKNKQITNISKNQTYDKLQCAKKLDSLTKYINSFERVHVPE